MRLHSYVVARDYGFAPNPFHGFCTLATCKPQIRKAATEGEWVVGTGSATVGLQGHLIYAMLIDEVRTFNEYWSDERFLVKRPNLKGSKKQAFGDNIYYQSSEGVWHQQKSHHTQPDGSPNKGNIRNDTGTTTRVLIGRKYAYWGQNAPKIPDAFRDCGGHDICAGRGHKNRFPAAMVQDFVAWLEARGEWGRHGEPVDWAKSP